MEDLTLTFTKVLVLKTSKKEGGKSIHMSNLIQRVVFGGVKAGQKAVD